jgi:hypothetical protein
LTVENDAEGHRVIVHSTIKSVSEQWVYSNKTMKNVKSEKYIDIPYQRDEEGAKVACSPKSPDDYKNGFHMAK